MPRETADRTERRGQNRPLIIVIGRGHSGTRLIAHTLRDSGVFLGARLNPSGSGDLVPAEDLYAACRIAARYVSYQGNATWDFTRMLAAPLDPAFVAFVRRYLASVLHSRAPRRGWKLPETTLVYPWIVRLFPDARYVFWVRDPRDVILGSHKTDDLRDFGIEYDAPGENPLFRRAMSWKYQWDLVQATPRPTHFLRVRFEDFVRRQDHELDRLERFLGFRPVKLPVSASPIGRWKRRIGAVDFPFLRPALEALGYEPPDENLA